MWELLNKIDRSSKTWNDNAKARKKYLKNERGKKNWNWFCSSFDSFAHIVYYSRNFSFLFFNFMGKADVNLFSLKPANRVKIFSKKKPQNSRFFLIEQPLGRVGVEKRIYRAATEESFLISLMASTTILQFSFGDVEEEKFSLWMTIKLCNEALNHQNHSFHPFYAWWDENIYKKIHLNTCWSETRVVSEENSSWKENLVDSKGGRLT